MKSKKEPIRTCIVCRREYNKKDLIRLYFQGEKVEVTENNKSLGRGAYICKNEECLIGLKGKKVLSKTFKTNFSDSDYEEVIEKINKVR